MPPLLPHRLHGVKGFVADLASDTFGERVYGANMATSPLARIRKGSRAHLYIEEHMAAKGLSDVVVAGRCEVTRQTVWKWAKEQHRLNPEKIALLAWALDLEHPRDLYSPPGRSILDEMSLDQLETMAADIVKRLRAG